MPTNFAIAIHRRQGYGDDQDYLNGIEDDVPFVGLEETTLFDCPDVDPSERAVLMFQTRAVNSSKNVSSINGHTWHGGIPVSPDRNAWNGNTMLLESGVLRPRGNRLHIAARTTGGLTIGEIDNFIIDNFVVLYKTR